MNKKEILVIDDDPDIRFMLKKRFEATGYKFHGVTRAETALHSLKDSQPDLVILDLGLKQADGTAFLKHIREWLPQGVNIPPIIILSGHSSKEIINYCLENGAKEFIAKPADPETLMRVVKKYLI